MTQPIADLANELLVELTGDANFSVPSFDLTDPKFNIPFDPNSDLYASVKHLTNADITTKDIQGTGTFDVLMAGISAQLKEELDSERINKEQYTKIYTSGLSIALENAVNFLIQKDQVFWQSQTAQYEAIKARMDAETSKLALMATLVDVYTRKVQYALTKEQLASAKLDYDSNAFNVSNLLPLQSKSLDIKNQSDQYLLNTQLPIQTDLITVQRDSEKINMATAQYNLDNLLPLQNTSLDIKNKSDQYTLTEQMPVQTGILLAQKANEEVNKDISAYNLSDILPTQKAGILVSNATSQYNLDSVLPLQNLSMDIKNKSDQYILTNQMPIQTDLLSAQKDNEEINKAISAYNLSDILPTQKAGMIISNDTSQYNLDTILPLQKATQELQNSTSQFSLDKLLPQELVNSQTQNTLLVSQTKGQDVSNTAAQFNVDELLPKQADQLSIQNDTSRYNLSTVLPTQVALAKDQDIGAQIQNQTAQFSLNNIMPTQWSLLKEQVESQIAQTKETRSDGTPLFGVMGAQVALYRQQIESYKRDAESKGIKLMLDPWTVAKSADEGVETPASINNDSINVSATKYLANLGLK